MSAIYVSGVHSGQNPCAGVGIATCLRDAFPGLKIIGIDHWQGSSGLHAEVFDEVLILPQWKQINPRRHARFLRDLLDSGDFWLPALDAEVYWLAQNFGGHRHLLAPSGCALELTCKPQVEAFRSLGFLVPETVSAFAPDSDLHAFLRQNSWLCWLKGPYHEARRVSSWSGFEQDREAMVKCWKTKRLFLQRHIVGTEESICFVADQGKLLSLVEMQKRIATGEGKTWAGKVRPVDPEFFTRFSDVIRRLEWSGGGEIEYTKDYDGNRWIIECNPRFPAWIHGAALVGWNLPASLIASAMGREFSERRGSSTSFTRVVREILVKEDIGLPMPPDPSLTGWTTDRQKGKGGAVSPASIPNLRDDMASFNSMVETKRKGDESIRALNTAEEEPIPAIYRQELVEKVESYCGQTPKRMLLRRWTEARFNTVREKIEAAESSPVIRIGYSVKTSSVDAHLLIAKSSGFLAECISQLEVRRALSLGFPRTRIILNGPGKFWPLEQAPEFGLHMLFCDSLEEFDRVSRTHGIARVIGFRIQLPNLRSRFGVPVEEREIFDGVIERVRQLESEMQLGFHFHMPSWAIGVRRWSEAVSTLLSWCQAVERLTGKAVRHIDLGGGFFPSDLEELDFVWVQRVVREALPSVEAIYFEPGRALTQDGEVLVSKVLDVRRTKDRRVEEVVVDACIAELPMIHSFSHRVFYRASGRSGDSKLTFLRAGDTRVLGRICMENDVLDHGLKIPESVEIGDLLLFADAGAYDRSMSYDFGRG